MMLQYLKRTQKQLAQFSRKVVLYYFSPQVILLLLFFAGCSTKQSEAENSNVDLIQTNVICSIEGIPDVVTGNSLQTVEYSWSNTDQFESKDNLMVKVHFVNADNKILFQDDHVFLSDKSRFLYKREVLIPLIPRTQIVRMMVGLFESGSDTKYSMKNDKDLAGKKVEVFRFTVKPPLNIDDLPEARITFDQGWYPKEYGSSPNDSWRWIGPISKCQLKGADRDLTLYLHGWVPSEQINKPVTLSFSLNGDELGVYSSLSGEFIIKRVIENKLIENNKIAELLIKADSYFSPADSGNIEDSRELSVMIKTIYFN